MGLVEAMGDLEELFTHNFIIGLLSQGRTPLVSPTPSLSLFEGTQFWRGGGRTGDQNDPHQRFGKVKVHVCGRTANVRERKNLTLKLTSLRQRGPIQQLRSLFPLNVSAFWLQVFQKFFRTPRGILSVHRNAYIFNVYIYII